MKTASCLVVSLIFISTVTYSSQALKLTRSDWWGQSESEEWQPGYQVNIEAEALFNNYEYTYDSVDGQTQFEWLMPLSVSYTNDEGARIRVGAMFEKEYGSDSSDYSFLASYQIPFQDHRQLLSFGSLTSGHLIHPALLDINSNFDGDLDQGMEWQTDYAWMSSDFWIDWQQILEEDSSEQFEVGWTSIFRLQKFRAYFDFLANHVGGEGDTEYTQIRNYGSVAGIGYNVNPGAPLEYEFGVLSIHTSYERNENTNKYSDGIEAFVSQRGRITQNWQTDMRIKGYRGDPVTTLNAYTGYQMGNFFATDLWFLFTGFEDVQLEFGTSLEWTDQGLQTIQAISLNWHFQRPFWQ